ncbi:MAG: hypothetical protein IT210_17740 [Armatimonadetes bacterium]|nr:hypothetical protein [Armatimonadota bacterium]
MDATSAVLAVSLVSFLSIAAICVCGKAEATLMRGKPAGQAVGIEERLDSSEARLVKYYRELMPDDQGEALQFVEWLMRSETTDRRQIR